MYGQKVHPKSGGIPIRVTFLSPAGRKIQTTTDIVSFWGSSYKDVRKDMRDDIRSISRKSIRVKSNFEDKHETIWL